MDSGPSSLDNAYLVRAVRAAVLSKRLPESKTETYWHHLNAGTFITAYRSKANKKSENVWCCMSNGEYEGRQSVWQNAIKSAEICATQDDRRTSNAPEMVEVTVLQRRKDWKPIQQPKDLSRERSRAVALQHNNHFAIFLPAVWNQYKSWTPSILVSELAAKAGLDNADGATIYEIGVYEINEYGVGKNHGYFV